MQSTLIISLKLSTCIKRQVSKTDDITEIQLQQQEENLHAFGCQLSLKNDQIAVRRQKCQRKQFFS